MRKEVPTSVRFNIVKAMLLEDAHLRYLVERWLRFYNRMQKLKSFAQAFSQV